MKRKSNFVVRDFWDHSPYCECPAGPYVGAHQSGTRARCENCGYKASREPIYCPFCKAWCP